jgi:hypothetical protein
MKPIHRAICSNARTVLWESTLKRKSWHSLVATVVLLLSVGCSAPMESVPVGDEEVGPEASETTTQVAQSRLVPLKVMARSPVI